MSRRHTLAFNERDKKWSTPRKKNLDLRVVEEGAGTYRGKKRRSRFENMDTVQIVGWRKWKNWIRRRSGRWMTRCGRGQRREGVGLKQKRILRLLVELGEAFQIKQTRNSAGTNRLLPVSRVWQTKSGKTGASSTIDSSN